MSYTDYQVYVNIGGTDGTVAGNDDWMYRFCKEEMEYRAGWDRQIVPPYIEYTTTSGMAPFNPLAPEQWLVQENDGNPMSPILVADDLRGYTPTLGVAPLFLKDVIVTGASDIASSHDGVMQAIALMQSNWTQGATTINGSGHYKTRWIVSADDPIVNGISSETTPYTVLSGLFKRLFTEGSNLINGGYIITSQPRTPNVIGEHNNEGRISLYFYQDPNLSWVYMRASLLAEFNAVFHPADISNSVATHGLLFDPADTIGFASPHQLICHMGSGDQSWIAAGAVKLVDIRPTSVSLIPVTIAFYAAHPVNSAVNRGVHFRSSLWATGATYLSMNGVTRINQLVDSNPLASPHFVYFAVANDPGFSDLPAQWASGSVGGANDSRGEIYEPWFGYNPFSGANSSPFFGQLHDCVAINGYNLVEGEEFTFDGRTFKMYSRPVAGTGRPHALLAFRVGTEDDATAPPS